MVGFALTERNYMSVDLATSIFAPLEVFRRFVWNFLRLENEHLNNCGNFRAVRDISIAPIDSSDPGLILRMMDENDGVVNRYTKVDRPKVRKQKDPERESLLQLNPGQTRNDVTINLADTRKVSFLKSVSLWQSENI